MSDYYTNTSEYSPTTNRFQTASLTVEQPAPIQQVTHDIINQPKHYYGNPMLVPQHSHYSGKQYKYNGDVFNVDFKDIVKRSVKYLLEGLAVAFVAYYFTKGKLDLKEVILLGITAAFVFAILDTFSPTISLGARFGAGFGIGQAMFGLNPAIATVPVAATLV
uniref:Uncharacterized protein n=1 Tax=viral metagenome TaxID=1070528 RepID=A0A6C0LT27_9ZZZZ